MLTWLEPYWLTALSILATALGLGFLLFIHEFGHFFVAKRAGVKVEVFSMGICHFLFSWTWRGTVYALSWMPLGGYVRMTGQQDLAPPPGHKPLPHEYGAKKPWVRMCIIGAGVTMNFIAGYLCFAAAFLWGRDSIAPVVGDMRKDLPCYQRAYQSGLRKGDRILSVDGDPVYSFPGIKMRVARIKPGTDVTFTVEHSAAVTDRPRREDVVVRTFEGAMRGLSMTPVAPSMDYTPMQTASLRLGFDGEKRLMITVDPKVLARFPAWRKDFSPGDAIVSVNGQPCSSEDDFSREVDRALSPAAEPAGEAGGETPPAEKAGAKSVTVTLLGLDGQRRPMELPVKSVYRMGIQFVKNEKGNKPLRVFAIRSGAVAGEQGIDLGDEIFLDRSLRPCGTEDFIRAIQGAEGRPLQVVVRAAFDGTVKDVELRAKRYWVPAVGGDETGSPLGSMFLVTHVDAGSQAAAKGLRPGAVISGISTRVDKRRPGAVDPDAPATLEWVDGGREHGPHQVMPFPPGRVIDWEIPQQEWLQFGAGESLAAGWRETRESLLSTTVVLRKLGSGKIGTDAVSGPVGIVHVAYKMAQEGLGPLLWLLGLMGVSLAFFNLLPIPVLDGGHLVFLVYEAVFRKPPSAKVVEYAQYAGLLIIVSLFVLVFWNDISKLIKLG